MLLEHFMIPSRNHPCGMTFTHLLKYFKIDVSDKNVFPPSVNVDCTLLKRMQASTRAHAQPPNSAFTTICFWFLLLICRLILCSSEPDECYAFESLNYQREDFGKLGRVSEHPYLCMLISVLLSSVCRLFLCSK